MLKAIAVQELKHRLDAGEAVLLDIREPHEHAQESIDSAALAPLSQIDACAVECAPGKVIVYHCKSGMRTQTNAAKLAAKTGGESYYLRGGIEAWKAHGLPVVRSR